MTEPVSDSQLHRSNSSTSNPNNSPQCTTDLALLLHSSLSDNQKYTNLTTPSPQLKVHHLNQQKRRFQPKWEEAYPWRLRLYIPNCKTDSIVLRVILSVTESFLRYFQLYFNIFFLLASDRPSIELFCWNLLLLLL